MLEMKKWNGKDEEVFDEEGGFLDYWNFGMRALLEMVATRDNRCAPHSNRQNSKGQFFIFKFYFKFYK